MRRSVRRPPIESPDPGRSRDVSACHLVVVLVLVRHALPLVEPTVPSAKWRLGPDGREAARRLAAALPARSFVVASTEPKARETGEEIGAANGLGSALVADDRLVEVRGAHTWVANHRSLARGYVTGSVPVGWEETADVAARFGAAVSAAVAAAQHRPTVLVTHGQAMTTWLRVTGRCIDAGAFWESLTYPDAWSVEGRSLRRLL